MASGTFQFAQSCVRGDENVPSSMLGQNLGMYPGLSDDLLQQLNDQAQSGDSLGLIEPCQDHNPVACFFEDYLPSIFDQSFADRLARR
jgi:hypothetical protein